MIEEGDEVRLDPQEQLPVTRYMIVNKFGSQELVVEVLSVDRTGKSAVARVLFEGEPFYVPLSRVESM